MKITRQSSGNPTLDSEFTYDGFSRWTKIVEKNNGNVTSTKQFIWRGKELGEERDANNNVTRRFFEDGEIINGAKYYFTRDHLGSVREMTTSTGDLYGRYDYDPYGRRTKVSGSPFAFPPDFGYTGHYVHAPSGLHLALYRAYDADIGRWLNRDPIGEAGGINLYGYVLNDPINGIDPDGLIIWGGVIGGVVGGITGGMTGGWKGALKGAAVGAAAGLLTGGLSAIMPGVAAGAIGGGAASAANQLLNGEDPLSGKGLTKIGFGCLTGAAGGHYGGKIGGKTGDATSGLGAGLAGTAGELGADLVGSAADAVGNVGNYISGRWREHLDE